MDSKLFSSVISLNCTLGCKILNFIKMLCIQFCCSQVLLVDGYRPSACFGFLQCDCDALVSQRFIATESWAAVE